VTDTDFCEECLRAQEYVPATFYCETCGAGLCGEACAQIHAEDCFDDGRRYE